MGNRGEGLSAARAGKIERRVKPQRLIAAPSTYTIIDGKTQHENCTLKKVLEMCAGVKQSTLKRRLDSGERNLETLRRKAAANNGGQAKNRKKGIRL